MDKIEFKHQIQMKVRDYELDLQGIVNNSVYLNYLEHARHEYLDETGVNFNELHIAGYDAVVVRSEVDYKKSLKSGDLFTVHSGVSREGRLRIVFHQRIIRDADGALMIDAKIFAACIHNNRPVEPLHILEKLGLL
ncbi:MAG TPA: acyl-CoA thioesterase [Bacteroidia bacterium]